METISVSERLLQELGRVDECEGCGALGVEGEFTTQDEYDPMYCSACVKGGLRTYYGVDVEFNALDSEVFEREELARRVVEAVVALVPSAIIVFSEVY